MSRAATTAGSRSASRATSDASRPTGTCVREPEPVPAGDALIFPDFALQHRRDAGAPMAPGDRGLLDRRTTWRESSRHYRSAHLSNLILCIDEARNCTAGDLPAGALVVRFRRRVDAAGVLRLVG